MMMPRAAPTTLLAGAAALWLAPATAASVPAVGGDATWETPPASASAAGSGPPATLTLDTAFALACRDSLAAILARLEVGEAEVAEVAAGMWENPELGYTMANIVLGRGYDQEQGIDPAAFTQLQHTVELRGPMDLWFKRGARRRAAAAGVAQRRLELTDAWRQLRHEVGQAFAEVVRHQAELDLALQSHGRYGQTLEICRRRRGLGDISQAELEKIELEELRYIEQEAESGAALAGARLALAGLLALADPAALPARLVLPLPSPQGLDDGALQARAAGRRPDLAAQAQATSAAELAWRAARRDRLPDVALGVAYIESRFQASGDNPHSLGVGLSVPLPLFDRNQAEVAGARLAMTRAQVSLEALRRTVGHEVTAAQLAWRRASRRLAVLDGGMVARAQRAQAVAARAWQAGATSLLDFLEADRTYLELQLALVQAQNSVRQAAFGLHWAVGEAW